MSKNLSKQEEFSVSPSIKYNYTTLHINDTNCILHCVLVTQITLHCT